VQGEIYKITVQLNHHYFFDASTLQAVKPSLLRVKKLGYKAEI